MNATRTIALAAVGALHIAAPDLARAEPATIELPSPETSGDTSLEETLAERRSTRRFGRGDLTEAEVSQLLWAAQGITSERGFRTAPSAGARYPLTVYVLRPTGLYRYIPRSHRLRRVDGADQREAMWEDVYARPWLEDSPAIFLIAADYAVTRKKYGRKAERFVHIEAGHVGQNILLQATTLDLSCVPIGAFHEKRVHRTLSLPASQTPLYVVAVGRPRD